MININDLKNLIAEHRRISREHAAIADQLEQGLDQLAVDVRTAVEGTLSEVTKEIKARMDKDGDNDE